MPNLQKCLIKCWTIGILSTRSKGFGVIFVNSFNLDPKPPHKMTACLISKFLVVIFVFFKIIY